MMRNGKDLINASKEFASEDRSRSWREVIVTLLLTAILFTGTLLALPFLIRLACCIACGLLYVRLFVIYHDYEHRAILQNSALARAIMTGIGVFLLAPPTIWKRSHEHHHNNNSKLTISGIGSYPTISAKRFANLTKQERQLYLVNRHPLTVILGYFTLFIYWLNLKSFIQSPGKHVDSLVALVIHFAGAALIWYYLGAMTFTLTFFLPFFIAFGTGSYLFYAQHNFPGAKFKENPDWTYANAAVASTSLMRMNPLMQWFTANIGYHHIHHINSRIPFYRLIEAHKSMPELHEAPTTSLHPAEMIRCFRLKLWDCEHERMITLAQFRKLGTVLDKSGKRKKVVESVGM